MVVWRALTGWVQRLFVVPTLLFASGGDAVSPAYAVTNSMSAMAQFPWIWTCIQAVATDMAGLPLVAARQDAALGGKGKRSRTIVDDPALELLEQPNAGCDGFLFRKQLWVDYLCCGNAYIWRPGGPAIYRLHPGRTRVLPGPFGVPVGFEFTHENGERQILPPDEVIHVRDVSWSDDPSSVYGETCVRCIHDDLNIELEARRTAGAQAAKGRPDVLFSIKGMTGLGPGATAELRNRWEQAIAAKHGAFVVGGEVTATQLGWSPDAFPFTERSNQLRDVTLALFGVPPTRAGLSTANYGGSRQEMRVYWESNMGRARPFERAWTRLAKAGVRIEYDYSSVESLQVSYTERLMRVSTWVGMGASVRQAADYEGFDEAPVPDAAMVDTFHSPRPIDRQPEEPQDDREKALEGRLRSALDQHLRASQATYAELGDEVDARLFVRWQTERLYHAFDQAGLERPSARWWAEEICGITDEGLRMGVVDTFTTERAARLAADICARRAA